MPFIQFFPRDSHQLDFNGKQALPLIFCFFHLWLIKLLQASKSLSLLTGLSKFAGGTMNTSLSSCLLGTEQTAWLISLPVFLFARLFV